MPTPTAIADEADALLASLGVRVRDDLVLARVLGDDRLSWLNGQLTADARKASPGVSVYALAVTVRGKIMADVWVLVRGDELAVLLPTDAASTVLESFERQIIMDDVTLERDDSLGVLSIQGPRAAELLAAAALGDVEHHACDELGVGGSFVLAPRAEIHALHDRARAAAEALGGRAVSEAGFELARLRRGRPRFGVDFGIEHYPQEAGLEQRAVAFDKGCYLGQEVVCTLENRGRLTKELVRLRGRDPAASLGPATPLTTPDGTTIGLLTSTATEPDGTLHALGYVKRAQAAQGNALLAHGDALQVLGQPG